MKLTHVIKTAVIIAVSFFSLSVKVNASDTEKKEDTSDFAAVPFMFSSDSLGLAFGVAGVLKNAGQPQASLLGIGFYTNKDSWLTYFGANNYMISAESNWLFGAEFYTANYNEANYYVGDASSNDSTENDVIIADGEESQYRLSARYILPIGTAQYDGAIAAVKPVRDINGHAPWNSGISSITFRPFYQSREFTDDSIAINQPEFSEVDHVWGLETLFDWDNRNDIRDPTQGSRSKFSVKYDPGSDDHASWVNWELNQSWYWDLGQWDGLLDQQVFAFNFYTSDTPTWNDTENVDGEEMYRRPPEYAGSRLGGLFRLRSFQGGRFTGRSALSYSMEYRVRPNWQPLGDWPVFNWYNIPWWEWVAFTDVGRVADDYDLSELHQDMKWSAGGAVRFLVEGVVVRTEMSWGSEESSFMVMVNQPF